MEEQVQVQPPLVSESVSEPTPMISPITPVESVRPVVAKPSKTGLFLALGIIGVIIMAAIILVFLTKPEAPPPTPKKTPAVAPQARKPGPTFAPSPSPTPTTVSTTADIEKEFSGLSVEDAAADITDLNADLQGL